MKNLLGSLMVLTLLLVSACDKKEEAAATAKPVVKIGASFPLSGNMSMLGNAAAQGLSTAIKEANKSSDNKLFYELLLEDDQMNPQMINNAARKFIYSDNVNAIFAYFSAAVKIVAPLAAKNKVINFNVSFSDSALQSPYNFQNFLTNQAEAEALYNFMKNQKLASVTLLFQNIGAADDIFNKLEPLLKQDNIRYRLERFNKGERDFKILVNKLKNNDDAAIMIYAFEPEADLITKEFKLQKINKVVVYTDGLPMTQNYDLYEGYYNVGSIMASADLLQRMGLSNDNQAYSAYLYDSGKILIDAFEKSYQGNNIIPSAEQIVKTLHNQKEYRGEVGKYVLDSKGQFHSSGTITRVVNGKLTKVEK